MIKIITVYNSLNPGSLLQAISLYEILEKKYKNVQFQITNIRNPYISGFKVFIKLILKIQIKNSFKQLIMPFKYNKILKLYNKTKKINKDDIYVLGSDEIWNVSRNDMIKHPILWGNKLNKSRCISYAPSINNSTVEDIQKHKFIVNALNELSAISVRDKHSKETIEKIINKDIKLTCDPTMLIAKEEFQKKEIKIKENNYIFIYGPERCFSRSAIKEIKRYAKENNKRIISYYFYHNWCDKTLYGSPFEFLGLISQADYVFTSTFHGTIFSIMYNKKFVSFGENNKKVDELLEYFNLNVKYNNTKNINQILEQNFNYKKVNQKISEYRNESKKYLYNSIDKILN